jgi:hypothetical protein
VIQCSGTTSWDAPVHSNNSVPFGTGNAQLSVQASAFDADTFPPPSASATETVKLKR